MEQEFGALWTLSISCLPCWYAAGRYGIILWVG